MLFRSLFVSLLGGTVMRTSLVDAIATSAGGLKWKVLTHGVSNSRISGLCISPMAPTNPTSVQGATSGEAATSWTQERIFSIDLNRQVIFAASDSGGPLKWIELLRLGLGRYAPVLPSACSVTPTRQGSGATTLILSEYLGKIWRFDLPLTPWGTVNASAIVAPHLLVDKSVFAASAKIRSLLDAATNAASREQSQDIFFEIMV